MVMTRLSQVESFQSKSAKKSWENIGHIKWSKFFWSKSSEHLLINVQQEIKFKEVLNKLHNGQQMLQNSVQLLELIYAFIRLLEPT